MLIRFSIENFLSFKDREVFSMIPGKGTLKPSHKSDAIKGISTLKAGIVFGANASGKSNLVKAIAFGQSLLLKAPKTDKPIVYKKFRLDAETQAANSRIEYEIQQSGKNYAYGFLFNHKEIVQEWLYEINHKSETKIFERNGSSFDLDNVGKGNSKKEQQFLEFTANGTPKNRLFLTEIKNRRVKDNVKDIADLLNVIDWFSSVLKVIFPEDKYGAGTRSEVKNDEKLEAVFQELLDYFDTGISGVCFEPVDAKSIGMPPSLLEEIESDLSKDSGDKIPTGVMLLSPDKVTYFFTWEENELKVEKFMTKHKVNGANDEQFDTTDESDGTNRIIDFIPLIIDLLEGNNVFVIDEMERSLHPNLIYDIIDLFLERSDKINSQIIIASHESSLLTQKLLRKDEIWFSVKDKYGASHLHSLEEYNVRFDKQIRKDYLLGRFKAIPRLGNRHKLTVLPNQFN